MVSRTALVAAAFLWSAMRMGPALAAEPDQPLPDWTQYSQPLEIEKLQQAVGAGDHAVVREHGWRLWAGIMQEEQGGTWPIWFSWRNSDQAFLLDGAAPPQGLSLIQRSRLNGGEAMLSNSAHSPFPKINVENTPYYPTPKQVKDKYPGPTSDCVSAQNPENICDGRHFLFNQDIMIPTESISKEAYEKIHKDKLFSKLTLDKLHQDKVSDLDLGEKFVVTKHMYWPVKGDGVTIIPVWHDYKGPDYWYYAGYETWTGFIALDPDKRHPIGSKVAGTYLHGVKKHDKITDWPRITAKDVVVHDIDEFYHHQVTTDEWQNVFDESDRAIIDAASHWANGRAFEPGKDYLVTVAMHVNTREIPSWALQSVWWSDKADEGPYAENRPRDLKDAKGPWTHYLLVDSYGIEASKGKQPVAMNPFIELVSHPVGTNCNTCHMHAGWPEGAKGLDQASYQYRPDPQCGDPLATLKPDTACLAKILRTDFQWFIPDRAVGPDQK